MNNKNNYILSCESTVDIPFNELEKRNIKVIYYKYIINNNEYIDNMDNYFDDFYKDIENGNIPKTSQLTYFDYYTFFKSILDSGKDILHICLGTGMTGSFNNALLARSELMNEYKDRDIIVINSLCSCSGYGLLVLKAYEVLNEEKTINSVVEWIENNKLNIHHVFYTNDLKYFKRTGRINGIQALLSSSLSVCPLMRLDTEGKIVPYGKAFGRGMAIKRTIDEMDKHYLDYASNDTCIISHANCLNEAIELRNKLAKKYTNLKNIIICNIGKIIASHCGPGTVSIYFLGDKRK